MSERELRDRIEALSASLVEAKRWLDDPGAAAERRATLEARRDTALARNSALEKEIAALRRQRDAALESQARARAETSAARAEAAGLERREALAYWGCLALLAPAGLGAAVLARLLTA